MKTKLFRLLALVSVLAMIVAPVSAQTRTDQSASGAVSVANKAAKEPSDLELVPVTDVSMHRLTSGKGVLVGKTESATGLYIIRLVDPSLASYRGGIEGLEATSPLITGARKLDTKTPASQSYLAYLENRHAELVRDIEIALGRSIEVEYQYLNVFNGLAIYASAEEALKIASLPGVSAVYADTMKELDTDVGPILIGAPSIWNGDTTSGMATQGEGVIIGVIDSGINHAHPSFADIGGDGYDHTNPYGSGNYVGYCDTTDPTFCNDKLIGAYDLYPGGSGGPEDTDGHGSHTASTSGGNRHTVTLSSSPLITVTIQGVAPHANIIAYKVCDPGCPSSSSVQAVNNAIADGVDVLNYSISGADDPWNDPVDLAFLDGYGAGIFVSASAGNDGPGASTVAKTGPWNAAVGASTHNRVFANTLDVTAPTPVPPGLVGMAAVRGEDTVIPSNLTGDIDYDPANLNGCVAFAPGTFTGIYALIQRGGCTFATKVNNAAAAGAVGVVVYNNVGGPPITMGGLTGTPPAVFLDLANGTALKDYIDSNAPNPVSIQINSGSSLVYDNAWQDILAGFSSRGPSQHDILKPDYIAPGVNILAAVAESGGDPVQYGFFQGTSMSSPHGAGAAALMVGLHPSWSPAEIKSAMASTAYNGSDIYKEDGVTPADPFDKGSGRLDLSMAGRAGIVLDETFVNYQDANPDTGGDPKTLNQPSFVNQQCLVGCSWTRVVSSTLPVTVTWTASVTVPSGMILSVTPSVFDLAPSATQMITVSADISGMPTGDWAFADVTLNPSLPLPADGAGILISAAHFPVAVVPSTGVLPGLVEIETRRDAGSQLLAGLQSIEITNLTIDAYGLSQASLTTELLSEDPTNSDPYDNLNDGTTFFITTTVPSGAVRLVAETFDSTAPDIDLYVGTGSTPSAATEVCSSTTPSAIEYCDIASPAAGTWWMLVQNWAESSSPPDTVTLAAAVVPGTDAGNLSVTGPSSVPAGDPFDLTVYYNDPAITAGDRWYGAFDIGSDPASPGDVGRVDVNLIRHEDDVVKTASTGIADPGDTVTYTLTVLPNVTPVDLTYHITDTIPAGMTYVPGSASASDGTVNVVGDTLTWTGTLQTPTMVAGNYVVTTSDSDPTCDTGFGGYVNLEDFGIFAQSAITGDTVAFTAFTSGNPINYFGIDYVGMSFTDDGFAIFDVANQYGGTPWVPQLIPDPNLPNNVLPAYWHDFELFYDAGTNQGVSLAVAGAPGGVIVVEYDNIELFGGSAWVMDFEIIVSRAVDDSPGAYEIVYAYDNVSSTPSSATIGWEDPTGTYAGALVNDGDPTGVVTDGLMVCMDYVGPSLDPVTITYEVTVDAGTEGQTLTNNAVSTTDNPGSLPETTSVDVIVPLAEIAVTKTVGTDPGVCATTDNITVNPGTVVYYCAEVTNTGNIPLTLHDVTDSQFGPLVTAFPFLLNPGVSVNTVAAGLTVSTTITQTTTNTLTWTAYNAGPTDVASDTATATVTVVPFEINLPIINRNAGP